MKLHVTHTDDVLAGSYRHRTLTELRRRRMIRVAVEGRGNHTQARIRGRNHPERPPPFYLQKNH
jgi:hypothetical protein